MNSSWKFFVFSALSQHLNVDISVKNVSRHSFRKSSESRALSTRKLFPSLICGTRLKSLIRTRNGKFLNQKRFFRVSQRAMKKEINLLFYNSQAISVLVNRVPSNVPITHLFSSLLTWSHFLIDSFYFSPPDWNKLHAFV